MDWGSSLLPACTDRVSHLCLTRSWQGNTFCMRNKLIEENIMGKLKDHYIDVANLEIEFISFVEQLLKREGYNKISEEMAPGPGFSRSVPDMIVEDPQR